MPLFKGALTLEWPAADDGILRQESHDLHRASALGADYRVDFIDLADHLGLAFGRNGLEILLGHP